MTDDSVDRPVTVLVNLPGDYIGVHRLADRFPSVRFVDVDPGHPIDPDVHGEVLVTRAAAAENLADLLDRGVRWVHCTGHGVDGLPLELVGGRVGRGDDPHGVQAPTGELGGRTAEALVPGPAHSP